jgi:uncharacterized protein YjeT (DUF2065 family)
MSPFSGTVLGGAALLSAPALWASLVTGTAPLDEGLLRYMGAVVVCWLGLSVVAALVGPAPRVTADSDAPETTTVLDDGPGAAGS